MKYDTATINKYLLEHEVLGTPLTEIAKRECPGDEDEAGKLLKALYNSKQRRKVRILFDDQVIKDALLYAQGMGAKVKLYCLEMDFSKHETTKTNT